MFQNKLQVNFSKILSSTLLMLLLMFLPLSRFSVSQELSPDVVLQIYKSPSAEFELAVDPSQRNGRGKAGYELRRHGQSLWRQDLPYTLINVAVADDGTSGGYGYIDESAEHGGIIIVTLMSPDGRVRREDRQPRQPSRFLGGEPEPYGIGLFLDPPNDRLVIRISDHHGNDRVEAWWNYTISSGAGPTRSRPRDFINNSANLIRIIGARPIPGLPLTLVQWYSLDLESESTLGTRFYLVDLHGHTQWMLDWPKDFKHSGSQADQHILLDQLWREGSILATSASGFELRQVQTNQRVRYSIKASADSATGWQVQEESRSPWAPTPKPAAPVMQDWTPPHRGTIHIGADSPAASSPIRNFDRFGLDGHGNFGFIRYDPVHDRATVVIVDSSGALIREIALPRDLATAAQPHLIWINDNRWLLTTAAYDDDAIRMTWLDVATGTLGPDLDLSIEGSIESVASTGDGGFVLLIDEQRHNMLKNSIYSIDAEGNVRWRLEHGSNETAQMITATPEHIIVLDEHPGELRVLDRAGKRLNTVDLASHRPGTHFSVLGMTWDRQDGVILEGMEGESLQISLDGNLKRRFTPEFPDGRRFRLVGGVQVASDGNLWTSDGDALLQLDTRGVVQRILGNASSTAILGEVALIRVDRTGRIHAMDGRTGTVHRYARDGSRLDACAPPASRVDSDSMSLTLGPQGELHVGLNDEDWIRFDPECTVFSRSPAADSEPSWLPQPGYPNR